MPGAPLSLSALASDALLEQAFAWLCQRRKRYPPHADVWNLRRSWPTEKARIQHELRTGIYQFGLLDRVTCLRDGQREDMDLWAARDAVVLKALSLLLPTVLPLSKRCAHLKGHGGAKYAVRQVVAHLPGYRYVLKTDVQQYYASIDHHLLLDRLARYISDRARAQPDYPIPAPGSRTRWDLLGLHAGDSFGQSAESDSGRVFSQRGG